MFFVQLRQLIWKNYIVRTRSKARVITEIIWPLSLFIILALVRTRELKEYQKECYLKEKALPSAGVVTFYRSLICTSFNWCYNDYQNITYFSDKVEFERARRLIAQLDGALITRFTGNENDGRSPVNTFSLLNLEALAKVPWPDADILGYTKELFNDLGVLNFVFSIFQDISDSPIGKFSQALSTSKVENNVTSVLKLLTTSCNGNLLPSVLDSIRKPLRRSTFIQRRLGHFKSAAVSNSNEDGLPQACANLFAILQDDPKNKVLFEYLYPFIRGKLIYAPNTPAFARLVEKINATFQDVREIQDLANTWLDVSPKIHSFLNQLEDSITSAMGNFENCTQIIVELEDALERILTIENAAYQLDILANFFSTYIECYEFDKFEGYPTEEEAVFRGLNLLDQTQLWAVIVFDSSDSISTVGAEEDELPNHITYKIRMDKFVIDSTESIKDNVETPLPRNDPRVGHMKYFTSGFIFLQDRIEQSITALQTFREQLPGMFIQQFPGPCVMFDSFLFAIGPSYPLFMNLAFVFACAVIIKSIVHEKEKRLKETMKTMGLGNGVHWVAWFIDSFSMLLIPCIILPIILFYGQILEKSNPFVIFVLLLSCSVATICFSFLVSTFFSQANLAAACGAFIYFLTYQPCNLLNLGSHNSSYLTNLLLSLFSNVAFGIANAYVIEHEHSKKGAQWYNLSISPGDGTSFSLLGCILMLLLDSVIYLIMTWYIENVFPGQYGISKPWYFMFQSSYWYDNQHNRLVNSLEPRMEFDNVDLVEENSSRNLTVGVTVRNLGKTYSGKEALSYLNIDFYEDQITSFLGHNGAGKTTTISILTGLFPPSRGTATINGLDIRSQMDEIRRQLGVCPQHNVLFDKLTVNEHLRFYSNLKTGKPLLESQKEIDKMIEDLGLSHKRDDISHHLSGGMKRKLSIGAAFIGNSKTVILDEPTAGVDPYSRRSIWEILLKYKKGRTIILTTHFMDEADLLGDRIAIISQGRLKCCGSSLFLKQKLGSGYYLTVVKKDTDRTAASNRLGDVERITSVVEKHIPNGNMVQNAGSDIVFCLPEFDDEGIRQRGKFSVLFDELDSNMEQLGVDSYGVSDTTLEEIFLRVADDPSTDLKLPVQGTILDSGEESLRGQGSAVLDTLNLVSPEKLENKELVIQQMKALYTKRFCNSKRSIKGFFCEIILPCVVIIVGELFLLTLHTGNPQPALILSPWLYGDTNKAFYSNKNPSANWTNDYITNMLNETGMGVRCLHGDPLEGLNCSSSDSAKLLNPTSNPDAYRDIDCSCKLGVPTCPDNIIQQGELLRYQSITYDEFYDLANKNISTWILWTHEELGGNLTRIGGFEFGVHKLQNVSPNLTNPPFPNNDLQLTPVTPNVSISEDNVRVWFDNKAWASSVAYLNAINNVILRSSLPDSKDPRRYGITVINHPMEYSSKQVIDMDQIEINLAFALTIVFSLSFVPASFVIFLVEERVSKAKHLQLISGLKPTTFWIATYTWDLVNYVIPCILIILIFLAFGQWEYVDATSIGGTILLLFLFGVSAIPLMYPSSFFFTVPSTAFVSLACANLFIGVMTTVSSYVLQLFDDAKLVAIGQVLDKVFLVFPQFCLGRGLMDLTKVYFTAKNFELIGVVYVRNIFEWNYLGRYFVSFIVQALIFYGINLALHYPFLPRLISCYQKKSLSPLSAEDEDVARERTRVENSESVTDELLLNRLTKIYNGQRTPATDRLSFGLRKGECFGLLGVNGAGKSTTFKMLTGDETVTSGDAFVGNHSILTNLSGAQQNLGYCPQEDALLPLLTGVEHLELFARLRGVPQRNINELVADSVKKMSLIPYKDRCSITYSGGNKRKLSTAIALVGNPSVVFLDEPSSGMDPGARRSLWQAVIDAVNDSRSVLITSHSMEECQVLCTRLAIMVNGTLQCLGSSQHLKNRFGNGYMINVRCAEETMDQVLQCVQSLIPEARLCERRSRQLIFHVEPNVLKISTLFKKMESIRDSATNMVDYSITQTTLDDVFIRFARLQRETLDEN